MNKNLYTILGVAASAGQDEIRGAYDTLIGTVHPDDSTRRIALKEAFGTLTHPQRRAVYDASLHVAAERFLPQAAEVAAPRSRLTLIVAVATAVVVSGWLLLRPHKVVRPKIVAVQNVELSPAAPSIDPASPVPAVAVSAVARKTLSPEALFSLASASIVRVNVANAAGEPVAVGSGVVTERGTVVTNCHVAKAGVQLKVKMLAEQFDATVTTADERHDLCKLAVAGLAAPPVALGSVAALRVGQTVYAIGSPQGLDLTLSNGMVSSLRDGPDGTFIQTTAPISPGSSGGGLFDDTGALVGIVTFQMRSGQNLNFAIPVDWIASIAPSVAAAEPRDGERAAVARPKDPMTIAVLGSWHCFGPLTGRGLDLTFKDNGSVSGMSDGKPLAGSYALQNKQLSFDNSTFQVEELNDARMVLNRGEGRRVVCNR